SISHSPHRSSLFPYTTLFRSLILIDDGSTDGSLEIAKSVTDPRVRVYSDGVNMRLAARLNQINSLARYDYIARMDADDLMSSVRDRKSTRLNSSHVKISYAVF